MKKLYVIIIILTTLVGCKQKSEVTIIKHSNCESEVSLNYKDSLIIPQTFSLFDWKIIDNKILIGSWERHDSLIEVYSYPSCKFLYQFGRTGQGQGEFIVHNWCDVADPQSISLYDIMRSKLFTYKVNDKNLEESHQYALQADATGLCRPFTKGLQINDSVFLLKEDNDLTQLHLTDLKNQKILGTYKCHLRDGKDIPYTPFDYSFNNIGKNILLAYNYKNRLEFLHINDNHTIKCHLIVDNNGSQSDLEDKDNQWFYLQIRVHNNLFYCLKSTKKGEEESNLIEVYDVNGNYKKKIILNRMIISINFDNEGYLIGYKENPDNTALYRFRE